MKPQQSGVEYPLSQKFTKLSQVTRAVDGGSDSGECPDPWTSLAREVSQESE